MSVVRGCFEILGQRVAVSCSGSETLRSIEQVYGPFKAGPEAPAPDLSYSISEEEADGRFRLVRDAAEGETVTDLGDLLSAFDGDLTVELQKLRPDLLFLHSGVVSWTERAVLLVADSGIGKSTTCWGLLHHGFGYMSDELAPVSLDGKTIRPYSHALCMKSQPPPSYPLPDGSQETSRGFHVPVSRMPLFSSVQQLPLRSVFVLCSPVIQKKTPSRRG